MPGELKIFLTNAVRINMNNSVKILIVLSVTLLALVLWPQKSINTNDYFTEVTYKKFNFIHKRFYNEKDRFLYSYTSFFNVESGNTLYLVPQYDPLGGCSPLIELVDYTGAKAVKVSFHVGSKEYKSIFYGNEE